MSTVDEYVDHTQRIGALEERMAALEAGRDDKGEAIYTLGQVYANLYATYGNSPRIVHPDLFRQFESCLQVLRRA